MWQNSKLHGAKVTFADDREPLVLNYLYDSDEVIGVYLNDRILLYIKNLQGDIVSVVNTENNEIVLNYYYDAWGNISYEASESNVGAVMAILVLAATNFSYRGYFCDYEIGLYYLQSRYYDPEVGRFINLDDTGIARLLIGELFSANLFTYCGNNPTNLVDYTGYSEKAVKTVVSAIVWMYYIHGFISQLIKSENHEIVGKIKMDCNGIFTMKIKYKPNKNKKTKKTFNVMFGDRNAWKNSSKAYNGNTSLQMDYYAECINEESVKLGTQQEVDIPYIQWMCLVSLIHIVVSSVPASKAKKIYNAAWGNKGLDPKNKYELWAYSVTGEKQLNGTYAYSIGTNKVEELSV